MSADGDTYFDRLARVTVEEIRGLAVKTPDDYIREERARIRRELEPELAGIVRRVRAAIGTGLDARLPLSVIDRQDNENTERRLREELLAALDRIIPENG